MKIHAAAKTDKGRLSDHNEDYFVARRDLGLYLVADGVGGAEAGELASHVACQLVEKSIRGVLLANPPAAKHSSILGTAIREASGSLFDYALREGRKGGVGTTLTALWFHGDRVLFAHVGDSRIYLYRDGRLRRLSRDDKVGRYRLAASLGSERPVEPHLSVLRLRPGDRFLLCTDGLYGSIPPEDLTFLLDSQRDPAECCTRLIGRANECGGSDNITALVADVAEVDPRQPWRFQGIWFEATSPWARIFRLPVLLGIVAAVLAIVFLWAISLGPTRREPPAPRVPVQATLLAQEANAKAAAGDTAAARAALDGALHALIGERVAISRNDLALDPAAATLLDSVAEAVWDDLYAPARRKLDALAATPAASYAEAAIRTTRERVELVHQQFLACDYTSVAKTFESLGKEVDTIVSRGKSDLARANEVARRASNLRAKVQALAAANPLRAKIEAYLAAASGAIERKKVFDAEKELDAAEAALKGEPGGK